MRRKRYVRRGFWAVALCAVLVLSAQSSRADDYYPGLPDDAGTGLAGWANAAQGGLTYAKRAKQWFRSPDGIVAVRSNLEGRQTAGDDDTGMENHYSINAMVYFVSPPDAPEPYGYLAPMTVRSVGFGLMPVEATVQVSQRREGGYPVPVRAALNAATYYAPHNGPALRVVADDTVVTDAFNVQILDVKVDGVDLELTGACRTVEPAPVSMVGSGYTIPNPEVTPNSQRDWFATHDPATYYSPVWGGDLVGDITIPAFTGCTTASGDDLSALMTLSVSGPGNPISARSGWPCSIEKEGAQWPAAPGQATPKSTMDDAHPSGSDARGCNGTTPLPYPERPDN